MKRIWLLLRTLPALGMFNLWRVFWYRLSVRAGINPVHRLRAEVPQGEFFRMPALAAACEPVSGWRDSTKYFGFFPVPLSDIPPDWHCNPLTAIRIPQARRPWWEIPDFDPAVGDIKTIWEASRFDWVLAFAEQARAGDSAALQRLQSWLEDWLENNPPYCGPNWKCGQEASIRVMHLTMAALILDQVAAPQPALLQLIELHIQRILPTVSYAIAQDNNHGTSEAAALFIGGSWLARVRPRSDGGRWMAIGRSLLENRLRRLVEVDGSFSQYSVNYHRVMLDTLSMAEVWRRHLALPDFSAAFRDKAAAATDWLYAMLQAGGDVPNLGANDGARLLPLVMTDYRDYRPSLQLAAVLFRGYRAVQEKGVWDMPLQWLGVDLPATVGAAPGSRCFDGGGYAVMRVGQSCAVVRYPRFRFRPSHADILHVDFWRGDRNLLRDAGTFSYNAEPEWVDYFPSVAAHNTVQFDGHDQMPRISRFLFGRWLKLRGRPLWKASPEGVVFAAAYRDCWGAEHERRVTLDAKCMKVEDIVSGFRHGAVLRWRLEPGVWQLQGNVVSNGEISLHFDVNGAEYRLSLGEAWESRYYLQRSKLPMVELVLPRPGTITTHIEWMA